MLRHAPSETFVHASEARAPRQGIQMYGVCRLSHVRATRRASPVSLGGGVEGVFGLDGWRTGGGGRALVRGGGGARGHDGDRGTAAFALSTYLNASQPWSIEGILDPGALRPQRPRRLAHAHARGVRHGLARGAGGADQPVGRRVLEYTRAASDTGPYGL